ncbi:MAG: FHA domain-containing protein [Lachnoclostridium sp.]|nr:FHA domain-containing protein [Lachnoclostridium sp.]
MEMILNRAYVGELPFVFANYCEDDFERIEQMLRILLDNECRLWHKEEERTVLPIEDPRKEAYPEKSAVVLSFISQNSVESHDWRKEFNAVMMMKKPVIAVMLDEMTVTPIMRMQLENAQMIEYKDCKTDGACCVKLLQMEEIKKCLEEEKTVLIPKKSAKKYYLIRKANSERIHIDKSDFKIGRKPQPVCDYTVADNVTISRVHAILDLEDGTCTIRDNNSSNKVYVNDRELELDEKCPIRSGDVIELGSEKFIVDVVE